MRDRAGKKYITTLAFRPIWARQHGRRDIHELLQGLTLETAKRKHLLWPLFFVGGFFYPPRWKDALASCSCTARTTADSAKPSHCRRRRRRHCATGHTTHDRAAAVATTLHCVTSCRPFTFLLRPSVMIAIELEMGQTARAQYEQYRSYRYE